MALRDDGRLVGSILSGLRELTSAMTAGQPSDPMALLGALSQVQRVAAAGLRASVALGRAQGMSWRELADVLGIPVSTLHRQYREDTAAMPPQGALMPPVVEPAPQSAGATDRPGPGVPPTVDLFVGRHRELAELGEVVHARRLVTLVGPAGVGKTRLAAETAWRVEADFPGGMWWVDLATVTREWNMRAAMSAAAGPAYVGKDPGAVAAELSRAGATLLVLDNCEHLLAAAARVVAELQAAAPRLHVVATSREAMRTAGEAIFPVEPLPSATGSRETARGADVVRLFGARARNVKPDFDIDAWADVIARIGDELDGLPLAIELAAHQSDLIAPDVLLSRLEARFEVLADPPRRADRRHRSLHDAIRWSYDLLDEPAGRVFIRLCILPGGFDERTAAAVTEDLGLGRHRLWAIIADVTRKSMVVRQRTRPGRFRILESLRAFGQEMLSSDDLEAAQAGLVRWLASLGEQLAGNAWGDALTVQENQLADEVENVRYSVDAAATLGLERRPAVVVLLAHLVSNRGELAESNRLLTSVGPDPRASTADRATAAGLLALNHKVLGDHRSAVRHAHAAVTLAEHADDEDIIASASISLMIARAGSGDVLGGIEVGAELIGRLRTTNRIGSLGRALSIQGAMLANIGDIEAADRAFSESITLHEDQAEQKLPISERFGNGFAAFLLYAAADLAILRGDDAIAAEYTTAILTSRFHQHHAVVGALYCAATLASRHGQHERALSLATGAAQFGFAHIGFRDGQLEAVIAAAERAVGTARARAAIDLGRALTLAELKRFALYEGAPGEDGHVGALTPREYEVAQHVARGMTNAQIAMRLSISERTVASHLAKVRQKLDLPSRVDVALWADRTSSRSA